MERFLISFVFCSIASYLVGRKGAAKSDKTEHIERLEKENKELRAKNNSLAIKARIFDNFETILMDGGYYKLVDRRGNEIAFDPNGDICSVKVS